MVFKKIKITIGMGFIAHRGNVAFIKSKFIFGKHTLLFYFLNTHTHTQSGGSANEFL